jgi:hypothetical protein
LRKINLIRRSNTLLVALLLIGGSASFAFGDDNFALAPGMNDRLDIFGPKGDKVAELSVPTISQIITVGSTSFQISYGLDANNELAAILSPSSTQPQPLHFSVLNKTIETDKQAVVTLTFPDPKHVIVDPGYIGTVTVNSRALRHRDLSQNTSSPTSSAAAPSASRSTAALEPQSRPAPSSASAFPPINQPATSNSRQQIASTSSGLPSSSDGPTANEQTGSSRPSSLAPPPLLGSPLAQPPIPIPKGSSGAGIAAGKKLFWAEPITPPNGAPPTVGLDQMKLVAVHGPVTLKFPDGETKPGSDGMLIPSGTSITTEDHGSVAIFMGGVDSARLLPDSELKVAQKLEGSTRKTDLVLKTGTVFSRVGHRPGEKQDYEVHTPEGVAAARGTSFSVTVTTSAGHEVTVCATQDGVVTLTDSSDGHVITVTPLTTGQISIGSIPGLPTNTLRDIFIAFMTDVQQFNTNMQAIANNPNPTPAELAYFNNNEGFDENTQFYDVNAGSLEILSVTPDGSLLFDRSNSIYNVVPAARRASDQQLEPFGTVPVTPF